MDIKSTLEKNKKNEGRGHYKQMMIGKMAVTAGKNLPYDHNSKHETNNLRINLLEMEKLVGFSGAVNAFPRFLVKQDFGSKKVTYKWCGK